MVKRRISLVLVISMVLSLMIPTFALGAVKDYTDHWAKDTIQQWLDAGYISGYPDGSFKPDGKVTRAEFVTMINKLFSFTETAETNFTDVKSTDWYYQEVQKAFKAGYIAGVSESQFAPNQNLTREQAAAIVARIMKLEGDNQATNAFSDYNKISNWALDLVGAAAKADLIKGYPEDNSFRPQNSITRAEAIITLDRTQGPETITIDKAGTVLENVKVKNIHITRNVGSGDVTLKNVTVTGELLIEGGGQNSVIIIDSSINELTTNKEDGKLRILLKGDTVIDLTSILSGVILEQQDLTGDGFINVVVEDDVNANQTVTIKADIKELSFKATIKVNVVTGIIESLIIDEAAEDLVIELGKDVKIINAVINSNVSFTGSGIIERAEVNANNVSFEKEPLKTEVAEGIKKPEITPPPSSGGSSGGSQPNDVTPPKIVDKPYIESVEENKVVVSFKYDEDSKHYYVCFEHDLNRMAPNANQVVKGTDGNDSSSNTKSGYKINITEANDVSIFVINDLKSNTSYDLYIVAVDNVGNKSVVEPLIIKTLEEEALVKAKEAAETAENEYLSLGGLDTGITYGKLINAINSNNTEDIKAGTEALKVVIESIKSAKAKVTETIEAVDAIKANIVQAEEAIIAAEAQKAEATEAIEAAEAQKAEAMEAIEAAEAQKAEAMEKIEAAQAIVAAAVEKLEAAQAQSGIATEELEAKEAELSQAMENLEAAQAELAQIKEQIESAIAKKDLAEEAIETATAEQSKAKIDIEAAEAEKLEAEEKLAVAEGAAAQAEEALETAELLVASLNNQINDILDGIEALIASADAEYNQALEAIETAKSKKSEAVEAIEAAASIAAKAIKDKESAESQKAQTLELKEFVELQAQETIASAKGLVEEAEEQVSVEKALVSQALEELEKNPEDANAKTNHAKAVEALEAAEGKLGQARETLEAASLQAAESIAAADSKVGEAIEAIVAADSLALQAEEEKAVAIALQAQAIEAIEKANPRLALALQAKEAVIAQAEESMESVVALEAKLSEAVEQLEAKESEAAQATEAKEAAIAALAQIDERIESLNSIIAQAIKSIETAKAQIAEAIEAREAAEANTAEAAEAIEAAESVLAQASEAKLAAASVAAEAMEAKEAAEATASQAIEAKEAAEAGLAQLLEAIEAAEAQAAEAKEAKKVAEAKMAEATEAAKIAETVKAEAIKALSAAEEKLAEALKSLQEAFAL